MTLFERQRAIHMHACSCSFVKSHHHRLAIKASADAVIHNIGQCLKVEADSSLDRHCMSLQHHVIIG